MVLVVNGVRILLAAVRSHIVTLAGPADVAVHNHLTVDGHLDSVALDTNLLGAPLPKRLVDDSSSPGSHRKPIREPDTHEDWRTSERHDRRICTSHIPS